MKSLSQAIGTIRLAASLRKIAFVAALAIFATSAVLSAQNVTTQPAAALTADLPIDQPGTLATPATGPAATAAEDAGGIKMVQPGSFEIHVRDTDLRVVLQLLSSQGRRNIVATKEVSGKFSADLYGVTFKEALDAVMRSTGFVYEERGNFVYVYTAEQLKQILKDQRVMVTKSFRLYYITATDAKKLLTPALSADGAIEITPLPEKGISPSKEATGGNSYATDDMLVVRDYEDNVTRVAELIEEMDIKPEQVLIEATILKATLNEDNALGINFNALAGIDFQTLQNTAVSVNAAGNPTNKSSSSLNTGFTLPTGGMSFGFVSNNIAFFISALEKVTPTTVLANPKLLVINKQRGEVLVGRHQGYQTTLSTETTTSSSIAFLDTGTRLLVRPYIGKNGYIRMEIHPEDSIGSTAVVGTTVIPSSDSTEATTNVLVRDGHTIVIGGLFRDQTDLTRSQVPGLGNLPGVGTLFRSTDDRTQRDEIIILITPRIIKQASDEALGEQLKDDAERYRIGARKDLQWFGRDRLATAFMRAARKDASAGETDKALWNVDLALSMSPQMVEAIQLKERLTGQAYWSDETRISNAKNIIERMITQEMGLPVEPIVTPEKPLDTGTINPAVRDALGIEPKPLEEMPGLDGPADGEKVEVMQSEEIKSDTPKADQTQGQPASAPAGEPVE